MAVVEWAEKLDRLRTVAHSRHDLPWREVVEAVRTTDWDEAFACSPSECVDIALGLGAVRRDDDVKVLHALADTLTEDLKAAVRLRIARSKQTYMEPRYDLLIQVVGMTATLAGMRTVMAPANVVLLVCGDSGDAEAWALRHLVLPSLNPDAHADPRQCCKVRAVKWGPTLIQCGRAAAENVNVRLCAEDVHPIERIVCIYISNTSGQIPQSHPFLGALAKKAEVISVQLAESVVVARRDATANTVCVRRGASPSPSPTGLVDGLGCFERELLRSVEAACSRAQHTQYVTPDSSDDPWTSRWTLVTGTGAIAAAVALTSAFGLPRKCIWRAITSTRVPVATTWAAAGPISAQSMAIASSALGESARQAAWASDRLAKEWSAFNDAGSTAASLALAASEAADCASQLENRSLRLREVARPAFEAVAAAETSGQDLAAALSQTATAAAAAASGSSGPSLGASLGLGAIRAASVALGVTGCTLLGVSAWKSYLPQSSAKVSVQDDLGEVQDMTSSQPNI